MAETFRDKYGGDAVAQAIARRLTHRANRERTAQAKALREGKTTYERLWEPGEDAGGGPPREEIPILLTTPVVVKEKSKRPGSASRVQVELKVWVTDEPMEFTFNTNMGGTLMAPQLQYEALKERLAKILKENFG